ncbi:amino acid permease [Paraneptunicella aestuarii]|uniref:APC family permease n=1 Tax=Paraneptunicella aestuarii TaxID=2831148 RepID=UPI001E474288|nr:amino acid permease [Paraneptunicella aestuarii]UAA37652.1 amino acid permease [Paraneptunicella aestuarii]
MPKRKLSSTDLVGFYISSILGAGILVIPGIAAQLAGPASILAWFLLIIGTIPIALTFTIIAGRYPGHGGITTIIYPGLGVTIGKSAALMLGLTMIIGNPFSGLAATSYLSELIAIPEGWPFATVAYGFLLLSVAYNFMPLKSSALGQRILTASIILILLIVCLLGLPNVETSRLQPFMPHGWDGVAGALVVGFFSFLGWENVVAISKDVKDPVNSFRKAFWVSLGVIALLYLMLAFFVVTAAPTDVIKEKITIVSYLLPVGLGDWVGKFGAIFAIVIIVISNNAWVMGAARLMVSLSHQEILPKSIAKENEHGVPTNALLFLAVGYALAVAAYQALGLSEEDLLALVNAVFVILYSLAFYSGIVLFKHKSEKRWAISALLLSMVFAFIVGKTLIWAVLIATASYILVYGLGYRSQQKLQLEQSE